MGEDLQWEVAHTVTVGRVVVEITATETDDGPRYTYRVGRAAGKAGEKRTAYLRTRDTEDALAALDEVRDWLVSQGAL